MSPVQKDSPFTIERKEGAATGTVIFRFCGIFTARSMFAALPPVVLEDMLNFHSVPDEKLPVLNILDLTDVPYMDSSGLGMIVRHHVRCKGKGVKFVAAGASPRVLELLKITKLDGVIPLAATVASAETQG
jgi:ABC-type transporter Mla MlaB component